MERINQFHGFPRVAEWLSVPQTLAPSISMQWLWDIYQVAFLVSLKSHKRLARRVWVQLVTQCDKPEHLGELRGICWQQSNEVFLKETARVCGIIATIKRLRWNHSGHKDSKCTRYNLVFFLVFKQLGSNLATVLKL